MRTNNKPLITIFGSHRPARNSEEYIEAMELGRLLVDSGFRVGTGGYGGIMEAALLGAGEGTGFTSEIFSSKANKYVTQEIHSKGIFDRIQNMIDNSDGLVLLKGGTGTLLELAACWELINKKMVSYKPIVCIGDFWKAVVSTLDAERSIENVSNLKPVGHSAVTYIQFVKNPEKAADYLKEQLLNKGK